MEEQVEKKTRRAKEAIIIPGAENMTPEELRKAKHNEKVRRYKSRQRGVDPGTEKKTGQELRVIDSAELMAMTADTRNLMMMVMNRKLQEVYADPDQLAKLNITSLATAFGILVDKHNMMNGMATENIAIHHKIDINMTSTDALEELSKMRATYAESNS